MKRLRVLLALLLGLGFIAPLVPQTSDVAEAQTSPGIWLYTFGNDNVSIAAIAAPGEVAGFVWGPTYVASDYTVDIYPYYSEADLDPVITAATAIGKPVKLQIYSEWGSSYANNIITNSAPGGPQDIFIASVEAWLAAHPGLDGVELDLEADEDLNTASEVTAYGDFIAHLYTHLNPGGYNITVNGSWRHPNLPASAATYLEYYTVGCYDFDGSTGGGADWPWYGTLSNIQTVISRYHTTQANGAGGFEYSKLGIGTSLAIYDSGGWSGLGYNSVVDAGGTYYLGNSWGEYTFNGFTLMQSKAAWAASVGLASIYLYNWVDYDVLNDAKSALSGSYAAFGISPPPPPTTIPPDIATPDTDPTVISIAVYRNLLETGDTLFRIYENIPYATAPSSDNVTISVDEAYLWGVLLNGASLGSNFAYPFHDSGYGYNVASLYFDNSTSITWGSANYTIRLAGTATAFPTSPPTWTFTIPADAWSSSSDQADEQAELAADVLALSATLDRHWDLTVTTSLLWQSEIGPVLSQQGMYFWNGAIPGLQGMAPAAYQVVLGNIDWSAKTWSDNYTTSLASQWTGVEQWLADAQQGGADFFDLDWDLLSVILVLVVGLALVIGNVALTGDAYNGFLDVSVWLVIAARIGLYGLAFLGLLAAVCVIYIAVKVWGLR